MSYEQNAYGQILSPEKEEAVEASVEGGLVAYMHRLAKGHHLTFFWDGYHDRVGVKGCACGDVMCHQDYVNLYIARLLAAYEAKMEEFAAETRRSEALAKKLEELGAALGGEDG